MTDAAPPLPSPIRRAVIMTLVMVAVITQILDITIINVALPHMQAALGAAPDTIIWVLTSYIVASAIVIPITGWLEARLGRRNLFVGAIVGFTAASAMCGMAASLEFMVFSRALQGLLGAVIAPLAQATLLDSSSREKHPQAMMIFSMGTMIGPIMGPILGGWLTEMWGWRWCFYVNVPIGIVASIGLWFALIDVKPTLRRMDLTGFVLLGLSLAVLQILLDRGSQEDWFDSTEIMIEIAIVIAALWMFVVHSATTRHPLVPFGLFRDRNFVLAVFFTMMVNGIGIAGPALIAPMLQSLMGYDAGLAGMTIAPRGIGALIAMPLAARLTGRVDMRYLIGGGVTAIAISLWIMSGLDLQIASNSLIFPQMLQGLGLGFAFLPLSVLAFSTLPADLRTEGAAFYTLTRNVSGSICISALGALLTRNMQISHADLGTHVTGVTIPLFGSAQFEAIAPGAMVASMIDGEINRQAMMIAYINDFYVMMWLTLATLPFLIFLRKPKRPPGDTPHMALE